MRPAERLSVAAAAVAAVAVAAVAVCSGPAPGQCRVLYLHLSGAPREALQLSTRQSGFLPRRCTTFPTPGPRSLPVLVDV